MLDSDIELYGPPNPALIFILNSNALRAICLLEAQRAKGIYQRIVERGTDPRYAGDRLHNSAAAYTEKTVTDMGTRWQGVMEVTSSHILPHEFGWEAERDASVEAEIAAANDLNYVLEML